MDISIKAEMSIWFKASNQVQRKTTTLTVTVKNSTVCKNNIFKYFVCRFLLEKNVFHFNLNTHRLYHKVINEFKYNSDTESVRVCGKPFCFTAVFIYSS